MLLNRSGTFRLMEQSSDVPKEITDELTLNGKPFIHIEAALEESAKVLFNQLVEIHRARPSGSASEFNWIRSETFGGVRQLLIWVGDVGAEQVEVKKFNGNDLDDLITEGLFKGTPVSETRCRIRIPGIAVRFYEWRVRQSNPEAISQVEHAVRRIVDHPERFAENHPLAEKHLSAAFDLIWDEELDGVVIKRIGTELRGALGELVSDLPGVEKSPEEVVAYLEAWFAKQTQMVIPPRQDKLIASLTAAALLSSNRLLHLLDERHLGEPEPTRDEVRRTAFVVALCCYEIYALTEQRDKP